MEQATPLDSRSFADFVKAIVASLNGSKITYAVTGALAASYYGVPRTTVDADFKVRIRRQKLSMLWSACEIAGLHVDRTRAPKRLRSGYNIVSFEDTLSAHTADFIIETKTEIDRRKGTLLGLRTFYESPESLILAKLRMIKATLPPERRVKDKNDIVAILSNTNVRIRTIQKIAERETTLEIFDGIRSDDFAKFFGAVRGKKKGLGIICNR